MALGDVVVPKPSTSPRPPATPPSSPQLPPSEQVITVKDVRQFLELLKTFQSTQTEPGKLQNTASVPEKDVQPAGPRARASRLEYKTIDERWNEKTGRYETVESLPPGEVEGLDEYVFIARARIDKGSSDPVFYIDVKSDKLRDILRTVLQDVHGISLREDKPAVDRNLLYHYLPELEAYGTKMSDDVGQDGAELKHLNLLVDFMKSEYASTTARLSPLLKNGEIIYDLLWALFRPNTIVYTICLDTEKALCIRFDRGEEKTSSTGVTYFHMECRYLDSDGAVFGEVSTALGVAKFAGVKRIVAFDAFPLVCHPRRSEMRAGLVARGRRFITLLGVHHLQYHGNAFYLQKGELVEVPVKSQIMVDAAYFRENNPNYTRPRISGLVEKKSLSDGWFTYEPEQEVKSNGREPSKMTDADLLLCSPTVRGWSFGNKQWLEFAVDDISPIVWNPSSFANLALPPQKKNLVLALAKAHLGETSDRAFDDFVVGKGRGLILLLQTVGASQTAVVLGMRSSASMLSGMLTAQISAGELGHDPKTLEEQLSHISQRAHHWKALVLLDEADVFVQARSVDSHQNARVSVFLRKLEYNQGIMFLTTNRVRDFDGAIQSRITLALRYEPLSLATRKQVWVSFLKKAVTVNGEAKVDQKGLDQLAGKDINGRQVRLHNQT
ncbi:MAG: hypothetical protein Q9217_004582 [Psora testacea]